MKEAKIPYLYVTGASYSGSTLLAFLLNAHPRMASISEAAGPLLITDFDNYQCSCGEPFLQCGFYRELQRRMEAAGSTFDLTDWRTRFQASRYRLLDIVLTRPLRSVLAERARDALVPLYPGYRRAIAKTALRNAHLARTVLEMTGKSVFVDAEKDSIRVKFLEQSGFFDLWVIHLVRDVRGGVNSYLKQNPQANTVPGGTEFWKNANLNAERARRYVPAERWMRLRYDDLCADTQGSIDRITDFVGVDRAPVAEDFYAVEHHIVGSQMRLKRDATIKLDEGWKERLTDHDLDTIARIAGGENRFFGFDWPR